MLQAIQEQIRSLFSWSDVKRPWHIAVIAAVCVGIPPFIGAATGQFAVATLASLGGMVILYLPKTRTAASYGDACHVFFWVYAVF